MAHGDFEFPYTPEQVESALGQFKAPEDLSVSEHTRIFWESEPTGVWQEKVDQTVQAISEGSDVVMLSARMGTGKTLQYGRLLERAYDTNMKSTYDADDQLGNSDKRARAVERSADTPIMVIDEMTGPTLDDSGLGTEIIEDLVGQKPLVLIYPGGSALNRRNAVERSKAAVAASHPEARVDDLGDISATYIDKQRGGYLLQTMGFEEPAIELFTDLPALRNPRLFAAISHCMHIFASEALTTSTAEESLRFFINPNNDHNRPTYQIGLNLWNRLVGTDQPSLYAHGPFLSTSITTSEAVELYQKLDVPLPKPADFEKYKLGFNPYLKN